MGYPHEHSPLLTPRPSPITSAPLTHFETFPDARNTTHQSFIAIEGSFSTYSTGQLLSVADFNTCTSPAEDSDGFEFVSNNLPTDKQ